MTIADREKLEEDRLLASIVDSSDDAIISKDLEGRILSWNRTAERMFGYTADEAIGQSITMLLPPERADDFFAILSRIQRGEKVEHYETVRRRRDGALLEVSLTVSPIHDDSGTIIGASKIARDITAVKAAERERQRTRDLYLGILGHDLRNPLNTIMVSLYTLEKHAPEELRHVVPRISRSAKRMARLIEVLLDFTCARLGEGIPLDLRPGDLREICARLVEELGSDTPDRESWRVSGTRIAWRRPYRTSSSTLSTTVLLPIPFTSAWRLRTAPLGWRWSIGELRFRTRFVRRSSSLFGAGPPAKNVIRPGSASGFSLPVRSCALMEGRSRCRQTRRARASASIYRFVSPSRADLLRIGKSLLVVALLGGAVPARAENSFVEGTVVDPSGAPVARALVTVVRRPADRAVSTDVQGHFRIEAEPGADLRVEARGFARWQGTVPATGGEELRIVVFPGFGERVAVSATRTTARVSETPASVVVLSSDEIESSLAPALDEVLRQVPGFSLFRRTDSRTANPTSQGVSLRGVGASGASRAAVLDDGVPLNDPFGGWVYWGRVPLSALERIELLRGGASDLYGGPALSGAVQLIRRDADAAALRFESSYGSRETRDASLFAAGRAGAWGGSVTAGKFRTGGYVPVSPAERGPIDREADSRHETLDATLERALGNSSRVFLRGSSFDEARQNGTALQLNDTRIVQLTTGADWAGSAGSGSLRAYASDQTFHQTFSSIAADRSSETLTRAQRVPARAVGLTGQWSKGFGAHVLVAGLEAREVRGSSDEDVFGRTGVAFAGARGRQATGALFLEDLWSAGSRVSASAGIRLDAWKNFDAELSSGPSRGQASVQKLSDRSETAVSPRGSLLYRMTESLSVTASAYRSFRAPTLNELYRSFRLGNVVTLANENLDPERATGAEAGAILRTAGGSVNVRGSFYWMRVDDTIANVTLESTSSLITRRRENLGRTRSAGVELEAEARLSAALAVSAGYLYSDSAVRRFSANLSLEGKRVAQVPRNQAAARLYYRGPRGEVIALQVQIVGAQFDDDLNQLRLAGYATFGALASFPISRGFEIFAAAENLLDRRYPVARTPVTSLGPPRSVRAGVRVRLGRS